MLKHFEMVQKWYRKNLTLISKEEYMHVIQELHLWLWPYLFEYTISKFMFLEPCLYG